MGWGDCGKNHKTGDMMGYCYPGVCSQSGCLKEINHGLSYVCGGMHEGGDSGCGLYFCDKHLSIYEEIYDDELDINIFIGGPSERLCEECVKYFRKEYADNRFYLQKEDVKAQLFSDQWLGCERCYDDIAEFTSGKTYLCRRCIRD